MAKGEKTGGRVAGVPNKTTALAREAIADFVNGNVDRLNGWLDQIAKTDPKDAFNCFMSVLEYNIPKLQRSEVKQDNTHEIIIRSAIKEIPNGDNGNNPPVQSS